MDPQHRLVLEVAWEALEDAAIPADRLAGTAAGVFLGMCNYDYAQFAAAARGRGRLCRHRQRAQHRGRAASPTCSA